jgi:hypothetical protein
VKYLSGLASNRDPPDFCLLSSKDYRREHGTQPKMGFLEITQVLISPADVQWNSQVTRGQAGSMQVERAEREPQRKVTLTVAPQDHRALGLKRTASKPTSVVRLSGLQSRVCHSPVLCL